MYSGRGRSRRRWWPVLGGGLVAVLAVSAAYVLGGATADPEGQSNRPSTEPALAPPSAHQGLPESPQLSEAEASSDPVEIAVAWLAAYRGLHYDDTVPTAWIDRVSPVVTKRLRGEYERSRDGSMGAEWEEFVSQRCTATVEGADGVIPAEAPRSRARVSVQVAGTLETRCQDDGDERRPPEDVAATLELVKAADGRWRVDRRLY